MKFITPALTAALLTAASASAISAPNPATANFEVRVIVQKACSVVTGASSNVDFGTVDSSATGLNQSRTISVTCSMGTGYTIGLLPSNNNTSGTGAMNAQKKAPVGGNTDTVPYQLRSVSATGANWGSTTGQVGGTGNGTAQSIPVFVTIPDGGVNKTPDLYLDTVTVQVSY